MAWERLERAKPPPASRFTKKSSSATASLRGMKKSEATAKRSEGGRIIGKRELKGMRKNDMRLEEYLKSLTSAVSREAFEETMASNGWLLARVTRQLGAGRVEVVTQEGHSERVSISGSLKLKGRASTKTDCDFVMLVNDIVLLHGPQIAAKLHRSDFKTVQTAFETLSIVIPMKGFFTLGPIDVDAELEDVGFEWDTSASAAGGAGDDSDVDVDGV